MKRFLLFAAAALIVGSANAQLLRPTNTAKTTNRTVKKSEMKSLKNHVMNVSNAGTFTDLRPNSGLKKASVASKLTSLKAVHPAATLKSSHRAGTIQEKYNGRGSDYDTKETVTWEMYYGESSEGGVYFWDVIPLPEGWESLESIGAEYTISENTIRIEPQKVAEGTLQDGTVYYYYLHSWESSDGAIVLTLGDDGSLTTIDKEDIAYSAFSEDRFDLTKAAGIYKGYVLDITDVKYLLEGQKIVPVAGYEPETIFLHPGPNVDGSYYTNLLMPVFADVNLIGRPDPSADVFAWSLQQLKYNQVTEDFDPEGSPLTGSSQDFTFYAENATYQPAALTVSLEGETSEEFTWNPSNWYAGGSANDWEDGSSPLLTFSKANPNDTELTYINPNGCKSTIFYQGKPASPLYFTGISFFVYQFNIVSQKNFSFVCKIHKAHRDPDGTFSLGELIAQSDLEIDNIESGSWMGSSNLPGGKLNWTQFYVEDEFGMSQDIDYLMLDEEFAVVFEGWDNGTFSGYPLMFVSPNTKGVRSSYAIITGEDTYTKYGWSLVADAFVGFIDATYGYLHTTDDTNITLPEDGTPVTIHVEPMYYQQDSETGELKTVIWLADDSDEVPDWLDVLYSNPESSDDISFDLIFALASAEGRTASSGRRASENSCNLIFDQWGGRLAVTVTRTATGISVTKKTVENDAPAYNLAGQRVNNNFKGLVVKGARKFVNK